jgi:hypothetical protein
MMLCMNNPIRNSAPDNLVGESKHSQLKQSWFALTCQQYKKKPATSLAFQTRLQLDSKSNDWTEKYARTL